MFGLNPRAQFILLMLTVLVAPSSHAYYTRYSLGLNLGLVDKNHVSFSEVENSGTLIEGELGVNAFGKHWNGDFRLGFHYDKMDENNVEVETRAFFLDLAWKYRLSQAVSLGPDLLIAFGEDVSFSDVGTNSDDKSISLFMGPKITYDFLNREGTSDFQIGLSYLWDLEIDNRQVEMFRLHLAWMFGGDQDQPKTMAPAPKPMPVVEKQPEPPTPEEEPPGIKINLKTAGVKFASGSSELNAKSAAVVGKLAEILIKYPAEWQLIRVDGHTDATGNYENNIRLSRERASSVAQVFVQAGIPQDRVIARGFGPDRPVRDGLDKASLAANRRVEVNVLAEQASEPFVKEVEAAFPGQRQ